MGIRALGCLGMGMGLDAVGVVEEGIEMEMDLEGKEVNVVVEGEVPNTAGIEADGDGVIIDVREECRGGEVE